ncbi:MAG: 1,4-dihydroxy-6-naphtoate synthase [Bacteroidetes bacterium ADurb.Bin408]|nr:MAG: 1,4-dihydroxy-6-naphtoate synthase [Bacteroidetes bacterium ADurb.Bin408]
MLKEITFAFSPCPNDTFMFDALVNGKIDKEGLNFRFVVEDVERLNEKAINEVYDVSKLSIHAFCHVAVDYVGLTSGGAFCDDFGPVLVSKDNYTQEDIKNLVVAIPGLFTSAAYIFRIFFNPRKFLPVLFSDVEKVVFEGKADMGVIIHENVFSFHEKGLKEVLNLGKLWQERFSLPVPLGCIAVRRSLPGEVQKKINNLIQKSLKYAFENPTDSYNFVKRYAPKTSDDIIKKHIDTYVNAYSLQMNQSAFDAVNILYNEGVMQGDIQEINEDLFIKDIL